MIISFERTSKYNCTSFHNWIQLSNYCIQSTWILVHDIVFLHIIIQKGGEKACWWWRDFDLFFMILIIRWTFCWNTTRTSPHTWGHATLYNSVQTSWSLQTWERMRWPMRHPTRRSWTAMSQWALLRALPVRRTWAWCALR